MSQFSIVIKLRLNNRAMEELINNKILIIKGILAEKCGLNPELYDELSELLDDIKILKKLIN